MCVDVGSRDQCVEDGLASINLFIRIESEHEVNCHTPRPSMLLLVMLSPSDRILSLAHLLLVIQEHTTHAWLTLAQQMDKMVMATARRHELLD